MNNNFNYLDENEIESQFDIDITDISSYPKSKLVQLIGVMHLQSRSNFSKTIDGLVDAGTQNIIIDLGELSYVDSAVIGIMIASTKKVVRIGGRLVLARAKPDIYDVFDVVGATKILDFCPTLEEAYTHLDKSHTKGPMLI